MTLKGTISKVDWVNPHIFVYLDVKDDAGKTTTWALQSLPPLFFRGSGLTKDLMMSTRQEVTVTANPAKDGTQAYGFMTKLSYADGHVFSMSPPDAEGKAKPLKNSGVRPNTGRKSWYSSSPIIVCGNVCRALRGYSGLAHKCSGVRNQLRSGSRSHPRRSIPADANPRRTDTPT